MSVFIVPSGRRGIETNLPLLLAVAEDGAVLFVNLLTCWCQITGNAEVTYSSIIDTVILSDSFEPFNNIFLLLCDFDGYSGGYNDRK